MPMDFLNLVIQRANAGTRANGLCLNIRRALVIGCLSVYIIVGAARLQDKLLVLLDVQVAVG